MREARSEREHDKKHSDRIMTTTYKTITSKLSDDALSLTKIKAHHIHPQSYMQTLNLRGGGGRKKLPGGKQR